MKPTHFLVITLVCTLFLFSCKQNTNTNSKSNADVVAANIDSTADPATDFFQFANGGWLKAHPIPAAESGWGIGNEVKNEIYNKLHKLSEDASVAKADKGSATQKIGDFYATGMDTIAIEKQGITGLQTELDAISSIKDTKNLLDVVAQFQTKGIDVMLGLGAGQDMKNSSKMVLYLNQGGLGMPNRDYYVNTDKRTTDIRKGYLPHVAKMLQLLGENEQNATKQAAAVVGLETNLAKASRKLEDLRDPYANYNKKTIKDLAKLSPSIDWVSFFSKMNIPSLDTVIVGQPEFLQAVEKSLKNTKLDTWKNYLKYHLVTAFAGYLPQNITAENFDFYGKTLSGRKALRPRWKRVLDAEEDALGDDLGKLFVKEYFPEAAKKRYTEMVDNVMAAYSDRIKQLDWMSAETKQKALVKLSTVAKKVGFPDKWKDYSTMEMDRNSYVRNGINVAKWKFNYQMAKIGKPVDRTEWDMTPQTYNAYYNPSNNEIVLPAAIFTIPGFPDAQVDDAVVYGYGAASTIGHEITHGFDDEGRQFDEAGNLRSWWTKEDETQFTKRAKVMIDQFNDFTVLDSLHVNGKACLGENIADLGGITLGIDAFKKTEQYKKGEKIAGYTPMQRYFLGYALGWMSQRRNEELAMQIMTDVHAPANLRVNGPFANVPAFYEAFGVKPTDAMYREDAKRVKIW